MSASAYLITIVCLAAVFAVGVFIGAKLERSSPGVATFAYRVGLLAGYAAGMTAAGWALSWLVIPAADSIATVIGEKSMLVIVIAIGAAAGLWGFLSLRKYDQRQRSGRFLAPREP